MADVRILHPGDESSLARFLATRVTSSLFLLSNLREAGLADHGRFLQGTWAARFEQGRITDVAGHFWNGRLILQAPNHGTELARLAVRTSGRALNGLIGPWEQVTSVRVGLGLSEAPATLESPEDLFSLELARLRVPEALQSGWVTCRQSRASELAALTAWRVEFNVETSSTARSTDLTAACEESVREAHNRGWQFVLEEGGVVVSTAAFNARIPECVQLGGVWTPPGQRGRGFARAVVAGALLDARAAGTTTSALFTARNNHPARRAYESLGYERVGDYGIISFASAHGLR